jgi:hypothetical protein
MVTGMIESYVASGVEHALGFPAAPVLCFRHRVWDEVSASTLRAQG